MAEAKRPRRGRSLSPPGEARVGPVAHSRGARPRFSLRGRRRGRAARASPGRSSAGEGPASPCPANPGSGREPIRPRFSRRSQKSTRLHGRRRVEAERRRGGRSLFRPGRRPGLAGSPLWWGQAEIEPVLPKARQAVRASSGPSQAT